MRQDLVAALLANQKAFGLDLPGPAAERLGDYFDLVEEHNPLLHLVAPCSAEEFAIRHILESLTLLEYLPQKARFADVGAGAGLPSIPCLLVRTDLSALLIETKEKKAKFLEMALEKLGLERRATVINLQFEEIEPSRCEYVTCRALDKFTERLPRLLKWAQARKLLLFGGANLTSALKALGRDFEQRLTPLSEKRFLFIVRPLRKT